MVALIVLAGIPGLASGGQPRTAAGLLAGMRKAVHPPGTRAVFSILLEGTTSGTDFDGLPMPEERFAIRLRLPDCYQESTQGRMFVLRWGMKGNRPLMKYDNLPSGTVGRASVEGVLEEARVAMATLALGILGETRTALPFTAEALLPCAGDCFALRLRGASLAPVLQLDRTSLLPVRVSYADNIRLPRKRPANGRRPLPSPPPPKERADVVLTFSDRRVVDGVSLPFHIRKETKGVTLREIRIVRAMVNPPVSDADFQ